MFSFDRGVCVCEQAGIWLPTNPNFAATCSSPVCVVLLAYIGKLREHQNGVNTFSTFIIFPVVLSHPPSSTVHCNCLPRSSISSQVHIWRSWLKLGPRELFEQGIGVSEDCTGVIEGQMVEQDCPMVTRWRRTASVDQTQAPYYLVRPPTAVSALLIPLTLPELLGNVTL